MVVPTFTPYSYFIFSLSVLTVTDTTITTSSLGCNRPEVPHTQLVVTEKLY